MWSLCSLHRLLDDNICSEKNIPSISSINRIIRDKSLVNRRPGYEIFDSGLEEVSCSGEVLTTLIALLGG